MLQGGTQHGGGVKGEHLDYSTSFSILGHDNYENYRRQQLLSLGFRAKLLYQMDPRIRMHDQLEGVFGPKAQQVMQAMSAMGTKGST